MTGKKRSKRLAIYGHVTQRDKNHGTKRIMRYAITCGGTKKTKEEMYVLRERGCA